MKTRHFIFIFLFLIHGSFSFAQGTWNPKPSFVMQRCLMSAFAIGSKGYIGTGNTPASGAYADLWEFDPVTSVWTQKANLPGNARLRGIGFAVNGKGYMGLGSNGSTIMYSDLWEYDPVANSWIQKANFPSSGRFGAVAFSVGSKAYVGTGTDNTTGQFYRDLWEYDPASNSWTAKANFGGGNRGGAFAFTVGNKVYVGTGNDSLASYKDLWEYTPATNTWLQKANFPGTPRTYGVGITIFNRGYAGTGLDSAGMFTEDWYEYNPATNTWATMAIFPGGERFHMIGFGINCRGYVGTGHWGTSPALWFDDWYEFIPTDYYFASISAPGGTAVCQGSSATLVGTGGVSYSWSTGATTTSIVVSPTAATTYTVTAQTAGPLGCTSTATVTVTIKSLSLATSVIAINCGSSNGSATAMVSQGGTPPYSYFWTPTNQTTQTATGLIASGAYTVNVSDASGCASTATISVVALNAPQAVISGNTVLCTGDATTLIASGGNTYSWSNGSTSTSIVVSPTNSVSTYSLIASIGNCHDTTFAAVHVYATPVASTSGNITICNGHPATISASGGNSAAPYNYHWNTGATSTSLVISPTTATTYSVLISIGTCKDSANLQVAVVPSPTAAVTGNTTLCTGDITTLNASGGNYYSWSSGQTTAQVITTPNTTTTYTVTVGNGVCADDTSITVNVYPPPVAAISGSTNICQGASAALSGLGGGTYLWSTGETTQVIHPSTAGTYSVVVTIGSCTDIASVNLNVHPLPTVEASADVTIVQGQSADISASGASVYLWNNGGVGQAVTVSPQVTTNYCVTGTDGNNCSDTSCVQVYVISCETAGELYLPNAFSPNQDGENDSLQVFFGLFDCIKSFRLSVYNRWGERIYFTADPLFRWSGIYNKGVLKNTDLAGTEVFTYSLEVELGDFSRISRKGNISLIR